MFKLFNAIDYICIDLANCVGTQGSFRGDKELFEARIQWVKDHFMVLEDFIDLAEDKPLYIKALHALRESVKGNPIGHLVALDATCSGIQIMSAITGCVRGADATGLISEKRADAYTDVTKEMNSILQLKGFSQIVVPRNDVKRAVMTSGYGSTMVPKEVFGEGDLLATFYQAAFTIAPAAFELMADLLETWQVDTLAHNWVMPDNFHVNIKVMQTKETRIEVDELGHTTFTTYVKVNQGSKKGLANVANTIHSIDGYLLRSVIRRASFDVVKTSQAFNGINAELTKRLNGSTSEAEPLSADLQNMLAIYEYSQMLDVSIVEYIDCQQIGNVPTELLGKLSNTIGKMLELGSSPVLTVHDAFRSAPWHCNTVRYHYKEIMAELAESNILQFIVSQIVGHQVIFHKKSNNLAAKIRNSNYAIC